MGDVVRIDVFTGQVGEQRIDPPKSFDIEAPLKQGDGDGTSGDVTGDWKTSVEQRLGQLHADVRALLNRGVAAVVALALMIGGLYLYGNERFDRVSNRLTAIEVQQAKIDTKLDQLLERAPKR